MFDVKANELLDHAKELNGAVVFITGGASGFGASTAATVANYGAKVFVVDLNDESLKIVVSKIKANGGTAGWAKADVTNMDQVRAAFKKCEEEIGTAEIVYANAGISSLADRLEQDDHTEKPLPWRDITLRVNLGGTLNTAGAAQEAWINAGASTRPRRLILTASMGGFAPLPAATAYASSKHGTVAFWKGINDALARGEVNGFECHTICPFFSATGILDRAFLALLSGIPLVPVSLVSDALIYAGCGCPGSKGVDKGNGNAVMLLDAASATVLPADEYGMFSKVQSERLGARIEDGQSAFAPYWRRFVSDLYAALLGPRPHAGVKA